MESPSPQAINPYAPISRPEDSSPGLAIDFPELGVSFSGRVDVDSVWSTRPRALLVGLFVGFAVIEVFAFVGMLQGDAAAAITLVASVVTLAALAGFVLSQARRPLVTWSWMHGNVSGTLLPWRIDMHWTDVEASFQFSRLSSSNDFTNHHGRLFFLRQGIPCFIPRNAVDSVDWKHIEKFRRERAYLSIPAVAPLRSPPIPTSNAQLWHPNDESFVQNVLRHWVLNTSLQSWLWMLIVAAGIGFLLMQNAPGLLLICGVGLLMTAASAGWLWLSHDAAQRDWPAPLNRIIGLIAISMMPCKPPNFVRWLDDDRVLIGTRDAWICVPLSKVQSATITPYAIQLRFSSKNSSAWYLERGERTDQQWLSAINRVRNHVSQLTRLGAVRREHFGAVSSSSK